MTLAYQLRNATRLPLQSQHIRSQYGVVTTRIVRRGPPAATAISGARGDFVLTAPEAMIATLDASSSVSTQRPAESSERSGAWDSCGEFGDPREGGARVHSTLHRTRAACIANRALTSSSSRSASSAELLWLWSSLDSDSAMPLLVMMDSVVGYRATIVPQPNAAPQMLAASPFPQVTTRPSYPDAMLPDPGASSQPS